MAAPYWGALDNPVVHERPSSSRNVQKAMANKSTTTEARQTNRHGSDRDMAISHSEGSRMFRSTPRAYSASYNPQDQGSSFQNGPDAAYQNLGNEHQTMQRASRDRTNSSASSRRFEHSLSSEPGTNPSVHRSDPVDSSYHDVIEKKQRHHFKPYPETVSDQLNQSVPQRHIRRQQESCRLESNFGHLEEAKSRSTMEGNMYTYRDLEVANYTDTNNFSKSDYEAQRHREWASDRSPLQRLELTLDSITKEEKRTRVVQAEADLKAQTCQNESSPQYVRRSTSPPRQSRSTRSKRQRALLLEPRNESTSTWSPSAAQKDFHPGSSSMALEQSVIPQTTGFRGNVSAHVVSAKPTLSESKSTASTRRGRSLDGYSGDNDYRHPARTVDAGRSHSMRLTRAGSNKLKKQPPGDPWYNQRLEAEKNIRHISLLEQIGADKVGLQTDLPKGARLTRASSSDAPSHTSHGMIRNQLLTTKKYAGREDLEDETDMRNPARSFHDQPSSVRPSTTNLHIAPSFRPCLAQGQQEGTHLLAGSPDATASRGNLHHGEDTAHRRRGSWKEGDDAALTHAGASTDTPRVTMSGSLYNPPAPNRERSSPFQEYIDVEQSSPVPNRETTGQSRCPIALLDADLTNLAQGRTSTERLEKDKAWWEERRRMNGTSVPVSQPEVHSDVPDKAHPVPSVFQPPIFLRCGPLLRYRGICRIPPKSNHSQAQTETVRWRGSIMIVTSDIDSSYEVTPLLRLFVQPVDLLPPPPDHVEEGREALAPEYVDPLAGLPALGRDGRTLYVRPVEELVEGKDLSKLETDDGLFEAESSTNGNHIRASSSQASPRVYRDGEALGKFAEIKGHRLHVEQDCTFWRFDIEVELGVEQQRIAYRINKGPATAFWVPGKDQTMNIMFYSCNGFTLGINPHEFSGPDPMWRDVLNTHQTRPFHAMIGGGNQFYSDAILKDAKTPIFQEWLAMKNSLHKHHKPFAKPMQDELERFYLNRYCTWFSQGLYGFANAQLPMVNIYSDHDIIDGFGSFPDPFMSSPVISGLGEVAFKYYMLFQHHSAVGEGEGDGDGDEEVESSWILGAGPGPYIKQLSRNLIMSMGKDVIFLGLDCRTERTSTQIITPETLDKVLDRCEEEIIKGVTKHLLVLLGGPIAYPSTSTAQNSLALRLIQPMKAGGKAQGFSHFFTRRDSRVSEMDDLEDHWATPGHEKERLHIIQDLQDLAAGKSIRIIILSGDVRHAAVGRFVSNSTYNIPKDRDHRYMPNIICSAIVNSPPKDTMTQATSKHNTVRHVDDETDEDLIALFAHDVDGHSLSDRCLLRGRNWCSIRTYDPLKNPYPNISSNRSIRPPATRGLLRRFSLRKDYHSTADSPSPDRVSRSFSLTRGQQSHNPNLVQTQATRSLSFSSFWRRSTKSRSNSGKASGYDSESEDDIGRNRNARPLSSKVRRRDSEDMYDSDYSRQESEPSNQPRPTGQKMIRNDMSRPVARSSLIAANQQPGSALCRPVMPPHPMLHSPPRSWSSAGEEVKGSRRDAAEHHLNADAGRQRHASVSDEINLKGGLEICLNVEVNQRDPSGITVPYRLLVPALFHDPSDHGRPAQAVTRKSSSDVMSFGSKPTQVVHGGAARMNAQYAGRVEIDHRADDDHRHSDLQTPAFASSVVQEQPSGKSEHNNSLFDMRRYQYSWSRADYATREGGGQINRDHRVATTSQQPSQLRGIPRNGDISDEVESSDEDTPRAFRKRRVSFAEEQAQRRGGFKKLIGI